MESAPLRLAAVFRVALVAAVLFVVVPSAAAAGVRIEAKETIVPSARALSSTARVLPAEAAPYRFNMVGVHWRGSGDVSFRTARPSGGWGAWRAARPEAEDLPDRGNAERVATRGWKVGNPLWTGSAERIQYRVAGQVRQVRAFFVRSPVTRAATPWRATRTAQPAIILRKTWGADERIVSGGSSYADRIAFSVVHHTAGAQPSSRAQSAAIVRGIQTYHVQGNGWNDIGYNFLVDRFGQIFEGRAGGISANVIGAHAQGFNTGSVGVAVLGTFTSSKIAKPARRALVSLISWRLDLAHVNPKSKITWRSAGNPKYPTGRAVRLRAVSGHRDTGATTCPGGALYGQLPALAHSVRTHGGPKIYSPRTTGRLGGPIRLTATVRPAQTWTVTVMDGSGVVVGSGSGDGSKVDWTWDSSLASAGIHRWTITAGEAREATGLLGAGGAPPPAPGEVLALSSATVSPGVVSPNGDGHKDTAEVAWTTSLAAEVRVQVVDAEGHVVARAYPWTVVPPGARSVRWGAAKLNGAPLPDGAYILRFKARAGAQAVTREIPVTIDRTLGSVVAEPAAFSPNGDGRQDSAVLAFTLARDAQVEVRVAPPGGSAGTVFEGPLTSGAQTVVWAGTIGDTIAADGRYKVSILATAELGARRVTKKVLLDTKRPVVSGVVAKRKRGVTSVRFKLDEPGRAVIRFGTEAVAVAGTIGVNRVSRHARVDRVRIRSWDAAGNASLLRSATVVVR